MNYTMENFISYCDDYQIANESFSAIKSKIISLFSKLILAIERKVKTMKDSKIKSVLMKLLSRAKSGLSKSKSLNEHNPEMVQKLQEEAQDIQEELHAIIEDNSKENQSNDNEYKGVQISNMLKKYIDGDDNYDIIGALIGYINADPYFRSNDFEIMLEWVTKVKHKDILTKLDESVGQLVFKENGNCTEDEYAHARVYLKDNFCRERIEDVKQCGKFLATHKNFKRIERNTPPKNIKTEIRESDNKHQQKESSNNKNVSIITPIKKAADEKNAKDLMYMFLDSLDVDPTFIKYESTYNYVKQQNIDGFPAKHKELTPFEEDSSKWDVKYYSSIKYDYKKNPSDERLRHMRKVVQVTHKDKIARLLKERASKK